MGFRNGAYATVWDVKPGASNSMRCRLSVTRKDKTSGEYVQDFSGYCDFWGQASAKASRLKERDRIKLGDVDVSNRYNKEAGKEYINFKVFDFEMADSASAPTMSAPKPAASNPHEGEVDEDELPF